MNLADLSDDELLGLYNQGNSQPTRLTVTPQGRVPASIRNNNPGAMWPSGRSREFGGDSYEQLNDGQGNKIARFPDPVSGAAAQFDLLARKYTGRPLYEALREYSGGNNVGSYLKVIKQRTGLNPNSVVTQDMLADPEFGTKFAQAMAFHEAGQEYPLSAEQWAEAQSRAFGGAKNDQLQPSANPLEAMSDEELLAAYNGLNKEPAPQQPQDKSYKSAILPFSKDAQGNVSFDSDAGLLGAVKRAVMLPGEVLRGELDPNSDEAIARAFEFSSIFSPMSRAGGGARSTIPKPAPSLSPKQQLLEASSQQGVDIARGFATDSTARQMVTQAARQAPWGGAKIENAVAKSIEQTGQAASRAAAKIAGGGVQDRATIGASARAGLEAAMTKADELADDAFTQLRKSYIYADKPVPVNNSAISVLSKIVNEREAAGASGVNLKGIDEAVNLLTRPEGATFNGLQRAKTNITKAIDYDLQHGGFFQGDLKRVEGVLNRQIKETVKIASKGDPKASLAALEGANQRFASTLAENADIRRLSRLQADEALFDKLMTYSSDKAGGNIKQLITLEKNMPAADWKAVGGLMVERLGKNSKGEFSPSIFQTKYNTMSPAAKDRFFGAKGTGTRQDIEDILLISKRLTDVERFANKSNTGRATLAGAAITGLFVEPLTAISSVVGGRVLAGMMAKPATIKPMARYVRAYERAAKSPTPANIGSLNLSARALALSANDNFGSNVTSIDFLRSISSQSKSAADDDKNQVPDTRQ